jgi:hypothetical protein
MFIVLSISDVLESLKLFLTSQNLVAQHLPKAENLILKAKPSTLGDALKMIRLARFAVFIQVTFT